MKVLSPLESAVDSVLGVAGRAGLQPVAPSTDMSIDTVNGVPFVPPRHVNQMLDVKCLERMAKDPSYKCGPESYGMPGSPAPAVSPGPAPGPMAVPAIPTPVQIVRNPSMHRAQDVAEKLAAQPHPYDTSHPLPGGDSAEVVNGAHYDSRSMAREGGRAQSWPSSDEILRGTLPAKEEPHGHSMSNSVDRAQNAAQQQTEYSRPGGNATVGAGEAI